LLSVIAGLLEPQQGVVEWDSAPLRAVPPHERRFALVFQSPPRMPGITVRELVVRPARRDQAAGANARVDLALRAVALERYIHRKLDELSGGEQQRSFLARTLVWKPRLILLDEPFSNLDVQTKRTLVPKLLAHQASTGAALLLVTHDASEATLMAERYVLIQGGRILSGGPTATAAHHPPSAFSALVFRGGSTNLVPAKVTHEEQGVASLELLFGTLKGRFEADRSGPRVKVALAPASLRLSNSAAERSMAVPSHITWTSAESGAMAIGDFPFGALYVIDQRVESSGQAYLHISPQPEGLPVFDEDTGHRVGFFVVDPDA
jgi:ABC-type sugar transport system ATPase subunit